MSFEDKTIVCADCGQEFIHSAEDQSRYAERGFTNEPKRCRDCREKRKSQQGGGGGGGRSGGGERRGFRRSFSASSDRGPRETFDAVCAACGAQTKVPFRPVQGRPVYCRDCYRSQRS
jgi:CxxC-x17-CxxC domain-containing protein